MLHFQWIGCGDIFVGVMHEPLVTRHGNAERRSVRVVGNPAGDGTMALFVMQPVRSCSGPFFDGLVEWDDRRYPSTDTTWCLVGTAVVGWSFDGTPYPGRHITDRTSLSAAEVRRIIGTLHDIVGRPLCCLSDSECTERRNIELVSETRLCAMRWLHIIRLASLAAGPRWQHLTLATKPLPRNTRIESMHTVRCAQHRLADASIAARRLRSPTDPTTHPPPGGAPTVPHLTCAQATKVSLGGESVRYIGWLSGIARVLLEECVIFLREERRTTEHRLPIAIRPTGIIGSMPPDAQCLWLETWEATDRQAVLEDAWAAWVRQCRALRRAHRDTNRHWEQFAFTVGTFGFDRLSLFEQARVTGVFVWTWTFIERIQMITLHAVAHFTPQLSASERAAFCQFTATTLLDFCGP
jgi:hypothetical protein